MPAIRTRFAPSPTGYMHVGGLRTALYEYLIAKKSGGAFILRIEDTDRKRLAEGAVEVIYKTMRLAGLAYDEGPDVGGDYGPYVQSERKGYLPYALRLVETGAAYYCFCENKEENAGEAESFNRYDRRCLGMPAREIEEKLNKNVPYAIRQFIPEGETTFRDEVFGDITIKNEELDDQVLIKSDGMPTYNFANVIDDHLMEITHVIRGNEYLSSTPKYNLLYTAFGWGIPKYIHLPLLLNENGMKYSKRRGDATIEDLLAKGYLPEAIVNYCALLGWSPGDNNEFFTLEELIGAFDITGISKSPSKFDIAKLTWMNGEYFKRMDPDKFYSLALPVLASSVKAGVDLKIVAGMVKTRINLISEIPEMVDFIDALPDYGAELYVHKKMKTDYAVSLRALSNVLDVLEGADFSSHETIHERLVTLADEAGLKNSQVLWPLRTALSGKPTTPCGAAELCALLGKEESVNRINAGIRLLEEAQSEHSPA